jgi:aspartokinase
MANIGQSITLSVKEIVLNDIFLQASIKEGYSNYSAIARMIKPMVDKRVGYNTDYQSIVTALKRFKPIIPRMSKNVIMILADSDISVKTGVTKITVEKTRMMMVRFIEFIRKYIHSIIHISLGTSAITIIMDEGPSEEAYDFLGKGSSLEFKKGLAAIIVNSPPDITDVPGCAISIYEKLFTSGINIEDTTSSYTDTVILVKNEDVGRAFEALNSLINISKKTLKVIFHQQ